MQENYITEEEREKCRKVVVAFSGAFEREDLLVLDAGKFGFVKVQYYKPECGFECVFTFNEGQKECGGNRLLFARGQSALSEC